MANKNNILQIIKEYEPKFNGKLHYESEPDKGIYDAMNKGLNMATRDIVGIRNSDDFLLREQCPDAKWCTKVY